MQLRSRALKPLNKTSLTLLAILALHDRECVKSQFTVNASERKHRASSPKLKSALGPDTLGHNEGATGDGAGDYSYTWSAAAGIDLFSTESTLTRAAEEAQRLSLSVGTEASFSGYGHSWSPQMNSTAKIWMNSDGAHKSKSSEKRDFYLEYGDTPHRFAPEYKTFGSIRAHIVEVNPRTNGFSAIYCVDLRDAVHLTPARRYQWDSTLSTQSITFTQHGGSPKLSNLLRVGGPNRAPAHNAFSGWAIEEMTPSDNPDHKSACRQWQLGQHPDVQIKDTQDMIPTPPGHLRRAPAAGENYPGWPSEPLP